jgi:alkyl sulfatase BDS1-like metallo-beta-lactamase superfamily hydrolase
LGRVGTESTGCRLDEQTSQMARRPKDATPYTSAANAPQEFGFDEQDFERASRGLVAQHPTGVIDGPFGPSWDCNRYSFIEQGSPNPDTVNPSLWRQAQLNNIHGLFAVDDGLWQARGYDISNITFIAGIDGWVIVDPLTVESTARACLELANEHLGERPVTAVIYTHSHTDHFGGVLGVTTQADVDAGRCRIIAPEGFLHEVVGENVIAGVAMSRRAAYQFGPLLPAGPRQHVDCGLGKAIPFSMPGLIAPTESVTHTGEELVVDGVRIVFQMTPNTEAPAEMNFFFPDRGWLCMAENCTHNLHNLVPIRGAQVRDALNWSKYIGEALDTFGPDATLMFASHHWPRWGTDDVAGFLALQRDLYRWIHDQTMRHANLGENAVEIAEHLELPSEFRTESHTTGYYGHLGHNVKAVYQRYLSWYDGNPANLWKLPPVEAGRRYVGLAGGPDALLATAHASFDDGDYRWVVELLNHLVFDDPTNLVARELQADAMEQLGYQSESATFRNAYLTGAQELRHGRLPARPSLGIGYLQAVTMPQLFDSIAVRIRSEDVGGLTVTIGVDVGDTGEQWTLGLAHRAIHYRQGLPDVSDVTVHLTRADLIAVVALETSFTALVDAGDAAVDGDVTALDAVFGNLDTFMSMFAIVEP